MKKSFAKRLTAILCAVMLILCIPATVFAAANPEVSVSYSYSDTDNTLTATVSFLSTEADINGGTIGLTYDTDALEATSSSISMASGLTPQTASAADGKVRILWTANDTIPANTNKTVATITFTVKDITKLSNSSITQSTGELDHFSLSDPNGVEYENSTLNVSLGQIVIPVNFIAINKTSLNLTTGSSETILTDIDPEEATNKTVTWASDNTAVATVDSTGKVTAVAPGTANITATADGKSATCVVTVTDAAADVPVTGVTINGLTDGKIAATVGETKTLTATVAPDNATNKTVKWTSSAPAVVEINETTGAMTAKAEGSSTITATVGDKSATCIVNVSAATANVPVTGVTINGLTDGKITATVGETKTLAATVEPSNATDKAVKWTSSAPAVVEINETTGAMTAKSAGSATITATVGGKTSTCTVVVSAAAPKTITAITAEKVSTVVGNAPKLPTQVNVTYSDGTKGKEIVTWNSVAASSYATVGTSFTVEGQVAGTTMKAICTVSVTDKNSTPNTGDEAYTALYALIAIILISGGICVYCVISSRNNRAARKAYATSGAMRADSYRRGRR